MLLINDIINLDKKGDDYMSKIKVQVQTRTSKKTNNNYEVVVLTVPYGNGQTFEKLLFLQDLEMQLFKEGLKGGVE